MIHKKNEHRIASVYYLIKDRYSPNFDRYHIKLDTTATNNPLERGPVSCTNKKSQCYIIIFCIVEVKANSFLHLTSIVRTKKNVGSTRKPPLALSV